LVKIGATKFLIEVKEISMKANIQLGRIWGIPVGLNISWFLIFGLLTWSLATGYFPGRFSELTFTTRWSIALVTAGLFFGSVLAHELGHALLALRNRIPVKGITLFIFGGVAEIGKEPDAPGVEFRIAIAGPLVSLGLGALFGGLWLVGRDLSVLGTASFYLMSVNLLLAGFNMVPGFPLDGGRVLRAIVWRVTGSLRRATQIASFSGQMVAFGFIGFGLLSFFGGNAINGLWLAFIGLFLRNAAAGALAQSNLQESLRGVTVSQVMSQDCTDVPSLVPLNTLVEERVMQAGQRCFVVTDGGSMQGMLTLGEISAVPRDRWRFTTTGQAMVPVNRLTHISPQTALVDALREMQEENKTQVPVMDEGRLVGVLSRERVEHYLRTRAELGL
jgi:Zn-dependent protease